MSLKFLAVGHSFAGIRNDKSPYAVRKENQLPTFGATPRFKHAERAMVQTDWLQAPKPAAPEIPPAPLVERQMPALPQVPIQSARPKRRWFSIFRWRWFQTSKREPELVQSELTLEKVQPIRNDLVDSDLRLVLKRKKKESPSEQEPSRVRAGWSELTARLFELGQK